MDIQAYEQIARADRVHWLAEWVDSPPRWLSWLPLGALLAYALLGVDRFWLPHDDGMLGYSARRILDGALPHRDFQAVYTGGLDALHALAMVLFGRSLLALHVMLWLWYAAWVLAVFWILRRSGLSRSSATLWTVAAGLLCIPQWSVPLPSWYNLFFATFGLMGLLHFGTTGRRGGLVWAGIFGGLSIAIKITGLYYVAGALFFVAYAASVPRSGRSERPGWGGRVVGVAYVILVLLVLRLLAGHLTVERAWLFLVPPVLIPGTVTWLILRRRDLGLGALVTTSGIFGAGVLIPLLLLALPYLATGATMDLVEGVVILPLRRLEDTIVAPPGMTQLLWGSLLFLAIPLSPLVRRGWEWALALLTFAAVLTVMALHDAGALARFFAVGSWSVPTLAAVALGAGLLRRPEDSWQDERWTGLVAVGSVLSMWGLVQFPWSSVEYVFYVLPLALVLLALLLTDRRWPRPVGVLFLLLFGVFGVVNAHHRVAERAVRPQLEGFGLRLSPLEASNLERLVTLVDSVRAGRAVYAAPDAPFVYDLLDLPAPVGTIYDFLDSDYRRPDQHRDRILGALGERNVGAVVIRRSGFISGPMDRVLLDSLARRFPERRSLDDVTVRWR